MDVGNIAARALIPAAVAIVFGLSRRYLPARSLPARSLPARSEVAFSEGEADNFSSLQWLVGAGMLATGGSFAYLSYIALRGTNHSLAFAAMNAAFMILPSKWIWFFFPLFGALCLAWDITLGVWRLLGNPLQARKYESWSNSKAGFNCTRVLRIFALVVALPILIATVLALPIHTSVTSNGVSVGHFGQLQPTEHTWTDVRTITVRDGLRLRDGSFERRPAIVLDFSDGTRWSSDDNRDPEDSVDESLLDFLQEKTNLPVIHIEAFPFGKA